MASLGWSRVMTTTPFGWMILVTNCSAMAKNVWRKNEGFERENASEPTKQWDLIELSILSMLSVTTIVWIAYLVLPVLTNVSFHFALWLLSSSIFLAIISLPYSLLKLNLLVIFTQTSKNKTNIRSLKSYLEASSFWIV